MKFCFIKKIRIYQDFRNNNYYQKKFFKRYYKISRITKIYYNNYQNC